MLCLGNLVVFLEALDYRTYLDLHPLSRDKLTTEQIRAETIRRPVSKAQSKLARKTFAEFRSWFIKQYVVKDGEKYLDIEKDIFEVYSNLLPFLFADKAQYLEINCPFGHHPHILQEN